MKRGLSFTIHWIVNDRPTDTHRALHQLGGGVLPVDGRFQDVPALDGHVGSGQNHPKNFGWDPGVKKNRKDVERKN